MTGTIDNSVEWWESRLKEIDEEISTIDQKFEELVARRKALKQASANAKVKIFYYQYKKGTGTNHSTDYAYIRAEVLIPVVKRYLLDNLLRTLAIQARVDDRTLARIRDGKKEFVTLAVADRILTACGRTDLIVEQEIILAKEFHILRTRRNR